MASALRCCCSTYGGQAADVDRAGSRPQEATLWQGLVVRLAREVGGNNRKVAVGRPQANIDANSQFRSHEARIYSIRAS